MTAPSGWRRQSLFCNSYTPFLVSVVPQLHEFSSACTAADMLIRLYIYIWIWLVLSFHFTVLKKTWALTAYAPWVAWWMSRVVSWPCYITAKQPWPASPAPKTLGNAVKSDKWHLWCHLPLLLFFSFSVPPQRGHVCKSHTWCSKANWEQFDLPALRELHNSQLIWCILEWMPSWHPALPCESAIAYWAIFISSLPPRCYFPCVLRERGVKPQPIYGSSPRCSYRMIQKHSYVHRHKQTHVCAHAAKKQFTEEKTENARADF